MIDYELAKKLKGAGCANCGEPFVRGGNAQVYCEKCRPLVRKTKNRRWQHDYYVKNKARKLKGYRAYNKSEHGKASQAIRDAVRQGKLKKLPCAVCGNPKTQGHHDDYTKPLEVRWLCSKHHAEEHSLIEWQKSLRRNGYAGGFLLGQLIEACGNGITLFQGFSGKWHACKNWGGKDGTVAFGDTSEIAVANLWLALHAHHE